MQVLALICFGNWRYIRGKSNIHERMFKIRKRAKLKNKLIWYCPVKRQYFRWKYSNWKLRMSHYIFLHWENQWEKWMKLDNNKWPQNKKYNNLVFGFITITKSWWQIATCSPTLSFYNEKDGSCVILPLSHHENQNYEFFLHKFVVFTFSY